nr:6025_t:CDS:1 [Entrophospora candida]
MDSDFENRWCLSLVPGKINDHLTLTPQNNHSVEPNFGQRTLFNGSILLDQVTINFWKIYEKQLELTNLQSELTKQQSELRNQQSELTKKQSELADQQSELTKKQSEVTREQTELAKQQSELFKKHYELFN